MKYQNYKIKLSNKNLNWKMERIFRIKKQKFNKNLNNAKMITKFWKKKIKKI